MNLNREISIVCIFNHIFVMTHKFPNKPLLNRLILSLCLEVGYYHEVHHLNMTSNDDRFENLVNTSKDKHDKWDKCMTPQQRSLGF